jgi:hypothetical protein
VLLKTPMSFFNTLFHKNKPEHPEDYYIVTITREYFRVEHPQRKTEQVLKESIQHIKIIITEDGPWLPDVWLALIGSDATCLIPHGAKGFEEVYAIVSEYDGFNIKNYNKAMSCTDNAEFDLWNKNNPECSI